MDTAKLSSKFERIGARLRVTPWPSRRTRIGSGPISLDVGEDSRGEYFEVSLTGEAEPEVAVLDVQPADRHLLLLVREPDGEKQKFLCGHDERHWFVAAVPESAPVGTVRQAKEALKPAPVLRAQDHLGLRAEARARRKNAAYRRQGEWFFLPAPGLMVDDALVLRNEPLRRGASKPHWCEFLYRTGGETVYVCGLHRNGLLEKEYRRLLSTNPRAKAWGWQTFLRNPSVYVRGKVRHADHRAIVLRGWHEVLLNTEGQSRALRSVAFLD